MILPDNSKITSRLLHEYSQPIRIHYLLVTWEGGGVGYFHLLRRMFRQIIAYLPEPFPQVRINLPETLQK